MNLTSATRAAWSVLTGRTLRMVALVTGGTAIGTVSALFLVRPEQWLVEHVRFEGLHHVTAVQARHLADMENGTPVWGLDRGAVARGVERHPWVRRADAQFQWPDTVVVTVEEHLPVALLHLPGRTESSGPANPPEASGLTFVDEDGTPFLDVRSASADELDLPHLTGFGADLDRLHPDLKRVAIRDALRLLEELDFRGLIGRDRVSEIAFDRTTGFEVITAGVRIAFGPSNLDAQLDRLAILVDRGVSLERKNFIDLAPASLALVRPGPLPGADLPWSGPPLPSSPTAPSLGPAPGGPDGG